MTRQNRGQWFLICQFKEKEKKKSSKNLWQGHAEQDRDQTNSPQCPGELRVPDE